MQGPGPSLTWWQGLASLVRSIAADRRVSILERTAGDPGCHDLERPHRGYRAKDRTPASIFLVDLSGRSVGYDVAQ